MILLGLQHIYITKLLRKAVFKILEEVIPTKKTDNVEESIAVDVNKGHLGTGAICSTSTNNK